MKLTTILLIFASMLLLGCDIMTESNKKKPEGIHKEIGILPKLISLPRQPISVKWKRKQFHRDFLLIALLGFTESDYKYIIENSNPLESKVNRIISPEIYDKWLPDEAKSGITVKPFSTAAGATAYELFGIYSLHPNLFANPQLSSYIHGYITPLKKGYILVLLQTM
jgi:hypothetical protein